MKPHVCVVTPGIYRMFFARFDVSQSSADEAAGLFRCYAWYIYRVLFAGFYVLKSVLMKPQVCDFTPGKYRVFFARFDVSQSSADEARNLFRCYTCDIQGVVCEILF